MTAAVTIAIYAGTRDPNQQPRLTTSISACLVVADFNGDGLADTLQIPTDGDFPPGIIFGEILQQPDNIRGISWSIGRNDDIWDHNQYFPVTADFNDDQ